jgi:hypothetical protein
MIIKTSELQGAALDYAVAIAEGFKYAEGEIFIKDGMLLYRNRSTSWGYFKPSESWMQGGPIIERLGICIKQSKAIKTYHWCVAYSDHVRNWFYGDTPLIAAMRCYVASKLGEEVEVPDELE